MLLTERDTRFIKDVSDIKEFIICPQIIILKAICDNYWRCTSMKCCRNSEKGEIPLSCGDYHPDSSHVTVGK